jgi:hypothetical protein
MVLILEKFRKAEKAEIDTPEKLEGFLDALIKTGISYELKYNDVIGRFVATKDKIFYELDEKDKTVVLLPSSGVSSFLDIEEVGYVIDKSAAKELARKNFKGGC